MLEKVLNKPEMKKYVHSFQRGETIFREGDETEDLYILVDGVLDVVKGRMKMGEVSEPGAPFGEMSYLLGGKRTATIKAASDARVVRIAKSEIKRFMQEFPEFSQLITELLAERLDLQTQIAFGLKELCDQLPDAVVLTDRAGRILSWNRSAEALYGRGWEEMRGKDIREIFEEVQDHSALMKEVSEKQTVREKVLKINHPVKGVRYVSISTTFLYDGHHNFQGMITLGRDLTPVQLLESKYRKITYWLLGGLILLGVASSGIYFGYPHFFRDRQALTVRQREFSRELASDYLLLKRLLKDPLERGERDKSREVMREFFEIRESASRLYEGLTLLSEDKKVFVSCVRGKTPTFNEDQGTSFDSIPFRGPKESAHKLLVFYRQDRGHAMGQKHTAVAFELKQGPRTIGWLVFSLDMDHVKKAYGMDEEGLERLEFKRI